MVLFVIWLHTFPRFLCLIWPWRWEHCSWWGHPLASIASDHEQTSSNAQQPAAQKKNKCEQSKREEHASEYLPQVFFQRTFIDFEVGILQDFHLLGSANIQCCIHHQLRNLQLQVVKVHRVLEKIQSFSKTEVPQGWRGKKNYLQDVVGQQLL